MKRRRGDQNCRDVRSRAIGDLARCEPNNWNRRDSKQRRRESRRNFRRMQPPSSQLSRVKERTVLKSQRAEPMPEGLSPCRRGDVVIEDLVEPKARDAKLTQT